MILKSALLSTFPWIEHGFGTRHAPLSQDGMVTLQQVHSSRVLLSDGSARCVGEGDALITNRPGAAVSIRTADCFPILLVDAARGAVAAIHAGWRGTAARVVPAALDRMRTEFGTRTEDTCAAIGPGIGACCYEVGAEVARQFGLDGAARVDLAAENRRQLVDLGVLDSRVEVLHLCTRCDASQFHSYRRDRDAAGRMISFIRLM